MASIHADVVNKKTDSKIIFTRHFPVMTGGLTTKTLEIDFVKTDRGGGATYHDPGQIIMYPIIRIADFGIEINQYNGILEEWLYKSIKDLKFNCIKKDTGIWIESEDHYKKVAFIGTRIKDGVSKYGFAINLNTRLELFNKFAPCGVKNMSVGNLNIDAEQLLSTLKHNCPFI